LQLHFRKAPDRDAIDIVASADQLRLSPALQAGFGADIPHVNLEGSLVPATPFAALFDGHAAWDRALDGWRQKEGAFHLAKLEMTWGGTRLRASGGLALGDDHRPQGTLTLDVEGLVRTAAIGATNDRLASAIVQLTKVTNEAPRNLSLHIISGDVNLQVTNGAHVRASAGTLGPIY
jgi:hypothetical protein